VATPRKENTMYYGGIVDEIHLDSDESGFELVIESSLGSYRFNVHSVIASFIAMGDHAAQYFEEGAMAALAHEADLARRRTDEAHDRLVGNA
jgi:hypothetical protein